jgi:hypothetical protein
MSRVKCIPLPYDFHQLWLYTNLTNWWEGGGGCCNLCAIQLNAGILITLHFECCICGYVHQF